MMNSRRIDVESGYRSYNNLSANNSVDLRIWELGEKWRFDDQMMRNL